MKITESMLNNLASEHTAHRDNAQNLAEENLRLKAENERLRKDADRLNCLAINNNKFNIGWSVKFAPAGNLKVSQIIMCVVPIRDAIDEAMKEDKTK